MGFYGQFTPLVQGYSCAESPLWLGKAFLCLEFPEDHPFWTAVENNGTWETLTERQVKETTLDGPALCYTDHPATGETILRSGKIYKNISDIHGMWNYGKLNYNTKFPWEATPIGDEGKEICESQQYLMFNPGEENPARGNITIWCGERDGVLYRRQFFGGNLETEQHWIQAINLADFPTSRGILRVDKLRLHKRPVTVTLGSYGFPDNEGPEGTGTKIIRKEEVLEDGTTARAMILIGHDHTGMQKQMAMTCYYGWEEMDMIRSRGTNPDSEYSIVVYASMQSRRQYGGEEPYLLISQVITANIREEETGECVFTEDELFPIREILYGDRLKTGAYGTTILCLKNGEKKEINFEGIESYF